MPAQKFEREILKAFNDYIENNGVKAYAYRNKQSMYSDQVFDIFIDSLDPVLYFALECKSVVTAKTKVLYFSHAFTSTPRGHQVDREHDLLSRSGRNGFLVIEARRPKPLKTLAYFVPFRTVWNAYSSGAKGIISEVISQCPALIKTGGEYKITSEFIDTLSFLADRKYPKKRSKKR